MGQHYVEKGKLAWKLEGLAANPSQDTPLFSLGLSFSTYKMWGREDLKMFPDLVVSDFGHPVVFSFFFF